MSDLNITPEILQQALGSKSNRAITNVTSLTNEQSVQLPRMRHWKDLGVYLNSIREVNDASVDNQPADSEYISTTNDSGLLQLGSNRALEQPITYRICKSCGNPILEDTLALHLEQCKQRQESVQAKRLSVNKRSTSVRDSADISDESDSGTPRRKVRQKKKRKIDALNSTATNTPTPRLYDDEDNEEEEEEEYSNQNNMTTKATARATATTTAAAAAAAASSSSLLAITEAKTATTNKKAKGAKETNKPKKERKKKTPAKSKLKGPVDVERQCGVPLPNGGFCARSLTCKTHSMGAKRAVLGRSLPYDQLLAQYQRKNQAKLGAAAAAAQQKKDDQELLANGIENGPVDEEEETHQVLEGVRRNLPMPLESRVIMPTRYRRKYLRMREMLGNAIFPRLSNNPLGAMQGRAAVVNVESIGEQNVFPVRSQHQKNAQQKAILRAQALQQAKLVASRGGSEAEVKKILAAANITTNGNGSSPSNQMGSNTSLSAISSNVNDSGKILSGSGGGVVTPTSAIMNSRATNGNEIPQMSPSPRSTANNVMRNNNMIQNNRANMRSNTGLNQMAQSMNVNGSSMSNLQKLNDNMGMGINTLNNMGINQQINPMVMHQSQQGQNQLSRTSPSQSQPQSQQTPPSQLTPPSQTQSQSQSQSQPQTQTQTQTQQQQMAQLAKMKNMQAQMAMLGMGRINLANLTPQQKHLLIAEHRKRVQQLQKQ
ncbi:deubiquitination module subunit [Martiniozyma asiatica (nom. inval.)]|nr:deubiquitination module subunit [Martiniozyma asiatica]